MTRLLVEPDRKLLSDCLGLPSGVNWATWKLLPVTCLVRSRLWWNTASAAARFSPTRPSRPISGFERSRGCA